MLKIKTQLILALMCMVVQGVWAQTEVSTEDELNNAITDGAYIRLAADITLSEKLTINSGQTVTIDLNCHKLSAASPRTRPTAWSSTSTAAT